MNEVLNTIKNRRTIRKFKPNPIDEEKLQMILEAGRWAPSFSNLQPWKFIVTKDQNLKNELDKASKESVLHLGINIALAGHSLGLGVGWIGVWGTEAETAIQKLFQLPETTRVVSLLPIGYPAESPQGNRKPLEEFIQFR
jgi:nitroreductase